MAASPARYREVDLEITQFHCMRRNRHRARSSSRWLPRPPVLPENGLTPVRLQLDWYPQPEHGGFYTAQSLGYYKAEGLDVTILALPQYGSVAQIVSTGNADVGLGSSDQILEWDSNGLPLLAMAATMQHDPQAVMVHKNSPVHDFSDLEGHAVAAQTGAVWLKYVISRYNLHNVRQIPSTLSIANFLADPNYVQQIFITSEPFFAQQAGTEVRTILISSSGYDPYRVQFTTRAFAAQHPEVVAKFIRASIRGWIQYLRDPAPTNALLLQLNPALNPRRKPTRHRPFATAASSPAATPPARRPAV